MLAMGEEGLEELLAVEVSSSSSSSETAAAASQESAMGVLIAFGLVEGEKERLFRVVSRPGTLSAVEMTESVNKEACLWSCEKWPPLLLLSRL